MSTLVASAAKRGLRQLRILFCKDVLSDEAGSEIVEFGLILLPLLAFVFLIIDVAWICFAQASLQFGVQAGVRAAISGYVPAGGQDTYVRSVVQQNAMGFLRGQTGMNQITINYYSPSNLSTPLNGAGSNAGGNVIEISVTSVPVSALGPLFRESSAQLLLKASSSDVMESSPNGIPPSRIKNKSSKEGQRGAPWSSSCCQHSSGCLYCWAPSPSGLI